LLIKFFFLPVTTVVVVATMLGIIDIYDSHKIIFRHIYIDKMKLKYKKQTYITNLYLSKTENSLCLQKQSEKVGSVINKSICSASGAPYYT
jgi:hypothetical protein